MYSQYYGCGQDLRSLASDDITGIEALYPPTGGSSGLPTTTTTTTTVATTTTTTIPNAYGVSLSVRAYKAKGLQKADLHWSGISESSVDIYRSGAKIKTTANDGFETDAINRKGSGSYTYQVCSAGTSTCSNAVSITF
jgi:hypothetical protein